MKMLLQQEMLKHQLVHPKENTYFALTVVFSIFTYIALFLSLFGIAIILIIMLFSFFIHALSMASIRRNGVRISEKQFPNVYEKAVRLANEMELKKMPSIYVMESSGFLNAFATRFFGKDMVVVYSEIFDLSEEGKEDELLFVMAHEFAHLKRRHVLVHLLLLPAMYIPFLGEAYLRGCEYTCDRYAIFYVKNVESSKEALTMLAIGKKLAAKVNQDAFIEQVTEESGFFAWFSEKLASHPDLPKRLNALNHWIEPEQYPLVREKRSSVITGVIILAVLCIAVPAGIGVALAKSDVLNAFTESTPLIDAAGMGDAAEVNSLVAEGEDMEAKDGDGSTALQWAVSSGDTETVKILLDNGADINTLDTWESTPLINAAYEENTEMVKFLLKHNPDTTIKDSEGKTALDYAKENNDKQMIELLRK
jgi:Zn-dependent protease with chaperone function